MESFQDSRNTHVICLMLRGGNRVMVFNATFNNISAISWRSVLFVEVPGEYHRPTISHCQSLSYHVVSKIPCLSGVRTQNVSGDRH